MKYVHSLRGHALMTGVSHLVILALLILSAVALVAPLRTGYRLKTELQEASRKLGELEVLYPLYADLTGMDTAARWPGLQPPPPVKMAEPEVVTVPDQFMKLAARAGIEIGSVRPHVDKNETGERYLHVEILGNGSYDQLKNYLMSVARMPSLLEIDRLDVRRQDRQEQITLMAHLALE